MLGEDDAPGDQMGEGRGDRQPSSGRFRAGVKLFTAYLREGCQVFAEVLLRASS